MSDAEQVASVAGQVQEWAVEEFWADNPLHTLRDDFGPSDQAKPNTGGSTSTTIAAHTPKAGR